MTIAPPIKPAEPRPPARRPRLRMNHRCEDRPPFETIALVLQGGGALGAYQAGVYAGLAEACLHPDWVAGISIGSINAAIIAGNPPHERADRLLDFWRMVTDDTGWDPSWPSPIPAGDFAHTLANNFSAMKSLTHGVDGFFRLRMPPPWLQPRGVPQATSFYDTAPLENTLRELVDFDRLNSGETRVSLGSVNVRTGNFVYFDTETHVIGPEHVMASGALPPGFPAVEIEGEHYWDGGLLSNTPLSWVVEGEPKDTLIFQVDLWSSHGTHPGGILDALTREKEIRYSSRTRAVTDRFKHLQRVRRAVADLFDHTPESVLNCAEGEFLQAEANKKAYNIIHLIYRSKAYETDSKDYEFSRVSMEERWRAGRYDTVRTLRHPEVLERHHGMESVFTFDLAVDGRE
jgi:NTE family protein